MLDKSTGSSQVWQFDIYCPGEWRKLSLRGSLDEISRMLPQGAYTTFRTYEGTKVLRVDDHFNRLAEAAAALQANITIDFTRLRPALSWLVRRTDWIDKRIRLTLDLSQKPGDLYAAFEPLVIPTADDYRNGVSVMTRLYQRQLPRAKLTAFINTAEKLRQAVGSGINEVIMVNDRGELLEGLSSNFFCVLLGRVWTAEEGVLPGITRRIVLESLDRIHFPVSLSPLPISRVQEFSEAFITSTSRAVLPVIHIDQKIIGSGMPGQVTRLLMVAYQAQIQAEITDI
jgi:branched-chain amino acid aminotransferase